MPSADGSYLVLFSGQLVYLDDCLASGGTLWYCKYEIVSGPDWKIVNGLECGITQMAQVQNNGEKIVFNFPIEVLFKSTNIYGWPQIVLSVYCGNRLQGYGRLHLPIGQKRHTLKMDLTKPLASSMLGMFVAFFGYQPELLQPKMLTNTAGNHLMRMVSTGTALLTIDVLRQNFQDLGYSFSSDSN